MTRGGGSGDDAEVAQWVAAAQGGDEPAFEKLYRHHAGRIYGLCLRMTGDAAMAEEMTQRAFVRAFTQIETFSGRSQFGTWLHRIALNEVLMDKRKQKWPQALASDADPDAQPLPALTDPGVSMDLEAAIGQLPNQARRVFVLRALYGHSHREIAEMLDIAESSCKVHYHRARQALMETMPDTDQAVGA